MSTQQTPQGQALPEVNFTYHVVSLVDILNQTAELMKMSRLPETEAEKAAFITAGKNTFGVVDGIRRSFYEFFNTHATTLSDHPPPLAVPANMKRLFHDLTTINVKSLYITDTMIFFTPTQQPFGVINAKTVYLLLAATAAMMQFALGCKVAMRGGITVGVAAEFYPNELYGPVLCDVHRLESVEAEYPRILVGDGLMQFLKSIEEEMVGGDVVSGFNRLNTDICKSLIFRDADGKWAVDFLGEGMRQIMGDGASPEHVQKAMDFVVGERQRFEKANDEKLLRRYQQLEGYFRSRIGFWAR